VLLTSSTSGGQTIATSTGALHLFRACPNMHLGPLIRIWIMSCVLLRAAVCMPVGESCWDCLAERSSRVLVEHPAVKGLTLCSPQSASAGMNLLSVHTFHEAVFQHYSPCRAVCGRSLKPLVWGEIFEISARAIMKCALRTLSAPAVAYSLRAHSLRCMLIALRLRKPHIQILEHRAGLYRDAVVYLGPPRTKDLRGKRGPGNWAEFKLSLQVVLLMCICLTPHSSHLAF
jgi:hypothetical protein